MAYKRREVKAGVDDNHEKKLSRKTLTFYIVALFSVAIALIMISYVAQSRANEQVANLSTQLNEQQTVAQGVSKKMEDLQKRYDEQTTALDRMRDELGTEQAKTDIVGAVKAVMEERDIYRKLLNVYSLILSEQTDKALEEYNKLETEYGAERLEGQSENSYSEELVSMYKSAREILYARAEASEGV